MEDTSKHTEAIALYILQLCRG